jgi:hypothetical protein
MNTQTVKSIYKRAFKDSVNQSIHSETPNFEWIVNLYSEIKTRLLRLTKKDSDTHKELDESFDVELFKQMIVNDVFNSEDMVKLVDNTYTWIQKLQAPYRDKELAESKRRILESDYREIIGVFVIEVNDQIDQIYFDVAKFYG